MKTLLVLLLTIGMLRTGYGQAVKPLPPDDPEVQKMATWMKGCSLTWEMSIGASGENYCLTAKAKSGDERMSCDSTISKVAHQVIGNFCTPAQQTWRLTDKNTSLHKATPRRTDEK